MRHKNSHIPESNCHPVRKMTGWFPKVKKRLLALGRSEGNGLWKRKEKKFNNRKRRRILNNREYDDKIG